MLEKWGTIGIIDKLLLKLKRRKGWAVVGCDIYLSKKLRRMSDE